jgi:hypothetical protein
MEPSWPELLFESGIGAGAISAGCVFATVLGGRRPPAALGFWGIFTFVASAVVITPLFLGAFAGRSGLLRLLQRA